MNFNVYVASATRFMTEFYRQLSVGRPMTIAAALGRKNMATESRGTDGLTPFCVDDWVVPVVFQTGTDLAINRQAGSAEPAPERSAAPHLASR